MPDGGLDDDYIRRDVHVKSFYAQIMHIGASTACLASPCVPRIHYLKLEGQALSHKVSAAALSTAAAGR